MTTLWDPCAQLSDTFDQLSPRTHSPKQGYMGSTQGYKVIHRYLSAAQPTPLLVAKSYGTANRFGRSNGANLRIRLPSKSGRPRRPKRGIQLVRVAVVADRVSLDTRCNSNDQRERLATAVLLLPRTYCCVSRHFLVLVWTQLPNLTTSTIPHSTT